MLRVEVDPCFPGSALVDVRKLARAIPIVKLLTRRSTDVMMPIVGLIALLSS